METGAKTPNPANFLAWRKKMIFNSNSPGDVILPVLWKETGGLTGPIGG